MFAIVATPNPGPGKAALNLYNKQSHVQGANPDLISMCIFDEDLDVRTFFIEASLLLPTFADPVDGDESRNS